MTAMSITPAELAAQIRVDRPLFGIDYEVFPITKDTKRAQEEYKKPEYQDYLKDLKTRIFVARGYAKMVLNDPTALSQAREDFQFVADFNAVSDLPRLALGDLAISPQFNMR